MGSMLLSTIRRWFKPERTKLSRKKGPTIKRDDWAHWRRIGGYSYTTTDLSGVPRWVQKKLRDLDDDLIDAVSDGRYIQLRGKHYLYRLVPRGQGAPTVDVLRRPKG